MATITANSNFDAEKAIDGLKAAFKGFGCDKERVNDILTSHNNEQLCEISKLYHTSFGKDLDDKLKSELSGQHENVCRLLIQDSISRKVQALYKAMKGVGTSEQVLIDVLIGSTNQEILAIRKAYKEEHNTALDDALSSELSGDFKCLMIALAQGGRNDEDVTDMNKVREDAKNLRKAGVEKWGTDESAFIKVFASRSLDHIKHLIEAYEDQGESSLIRDIGKELSGSFEKAVVAIAHRATNSDLYFAQCLYESMKGMGTDDERLNRTIVSRCEVDMVGIKDAYKKKYEKSLAKDIKGDCSGNHRKIMLSLIGE